MARVTTSDAVRDVRLDDTGNGKVRRPPKLSRAIAVVKGTGRAALKVVPAFRGFHSVQDGLAIDERPVTRRTEQLRGRRVREGCKGGVSLAHLGNRIDCPPCVACPSVRSVT